MAHRIDARIAWQVVGDQAVLVDLDTGVAIGLNDTGSLIWSMLEDHSEEQIVEAVAREFAVDADRALSDTREFVGMLRERRIVV